MLEQFGLHERRRGEEDALLAHFSCQQIFERLGLEKYPELGYRQPHIKHSDSHSRGPVQAPQFVCASGAAVSFLT
jgi:hypothetical protein